MLSLLFFLKNLLTFCLLLCIIVTTLVKAKGSGFIQLMGSDLRSHLGVSFTPVFFIP